MLASISLKRVLLSGTACAVLVTAAAASAQTAPSAQAADARSEDIVVTGTRIVRDGFEAPTPLTVMSLEDIQNSSPTNNVADFVNQLPSLAGSTKPANSRLNLSSGQAGINALNLRNLGETRTLVLIDGRRSVASTITGLVDVNTIPQALVERVEVVTGGASAAYGSDAVAGVVNFVLNKKYEGLKVSADAGITKRGDGFNYSGSVTGGMSFADGRGHVVLNAEVAHNDGIFKVDRAWNATGFVRIQNPNWTPSSTTEPQFLVRRQIGAANSTPGGLILYSSGGTANRLRGTYFGPGGSVNQFQYGALTFPSPTGSSAPSLTQGGDWQVNDSGRRIGLDPRDDRYGVFGRLSYEIADGVELFAEGSYNWQEVFFNAGPNLSSCGSASVNNAGIPGANGLCTLRGENAYLIKALGPTQLAGITAVGIGTTAVDLPFRAANNKREVQRYVVGAEGEFTAFGKSAHWDVYAQYGRADLREQLRNIMQFPRMSKAVDAVFSVPGDTSSQIVCRVNADADPTNNDPACVPLNRLGIGVADPAAIAYALGDPYRDETVTQKVVGANLSLTPFATWAGDVSLAVGGEYREEKIRGFVPQEFQPLITRNATTGALSTTNLWSVGNYLPSNGGFNVKEAYLETVVPLGLGLEFNGAVRATDYSTSGYVTTWKAGATWQPLDAFRLRVTRSRDIRAPNLAELFQAGSSNSDAVRNPFFVQNQNNPGPGNIVYPASISYSATAVGNPDLKPEKADTWNIGAVFTPGFLPGFNLSIDYFRIKMKEAIGTLSAQEIINRCFEGVQQYCDAMTPDPNSPGRLLFRAQPFNFVSQVVRGIDFDASFRRTLANGDTLALRGVATRYIDNLTDQGIAGVEVIDTVGVNGGQASTPNWLYRFNATYDTPRWSVTWVARGVSAGLYEAGAIECRSACPVSTTQHRTYDNNHVDGTFYVDFNLTAKLGIWEAGDSEVFVNVTNLFDAKPLLLPETGLAANSTYSDLLGQAVRVGFRVKVR
ncbi:TonB-dependent receptor [Sphingomonas sp. MAH-20]|uniref:TonB-dependent receptor n=1 Tax=Sphingomonas horti TaxID=2682842 RepID=A0A6I4IWJ5_9SPHN|nr:MULTISPECIES: TonB-dependent receptor [Sphingomonas]MBA2920204.1 TonB-dependent receptor [Sphingomonas sp. CGMCC 1.13658]MVO76459.1 TonB-dependent receptor [Sphingomonas horti]